MSTCDTLKNKNPNFISISSFLFLSLFSNLSENLLFRSWCSLLCGVLPLPPQWRRSSDDLGKEKIYWVIESLNIVGYKVISSHASFFISFYFRTYTHTNRIASLKRVQMRIYRGPDAGDNTQWGYFIRQPSFD